MKKLFVIVSAMLVLFPSQAAEITGDVHPCANNKEIICADSDENTVYSLYGRQGFFSTIILPPNERVEITHVERGGEKDGVLTVQDLEIGNPFYWDVSPSSDGRDITVKLISERMPHVPDVTNVMFVTHSINDPDGPKRYYHFNFYRVPPKGKYFWSQLRFSSPTSMPVVPNQTQQAVSRSDNIHQLTGRYKISSELDKSCLNWISDNGSFTFLHFQCTHNNTVSVPAVFLLDNQDHLVRADFVPDSRFRNEPGTVISLVGVHNRFVLLYPDVNPRTGEHYKICVFRVESHLSK